jgi:hypothetical protein
MIIGRFKIFAHTVPGMACGAGGKVKIMSGFL